jgi:hypothetical protein
VECKAGWQPEEFSFHAEDEICFEGRNKVSRNWL